MLGDQRIIIKGATLIDGDGTVIPKSWVIVQGSNIVRVSQEPVEILEQDDVVEAEGLLLTPGLVNLHTHSPMGLMRGLGEDLIIEDWFNQFIWRFESRLEEEDVRIGALLGMGEMIKNGVTAFADHYFFASKIAQAALEVGMRGDIAPTIFGMREDVEEQIELCGELIQAWHGKDDLIKMRMGPHAPYTCPPPVLQRVADMAQALQVGIHIHVSETQEQLHESIQKYGKTPFQILEDTGCLQVPAILGHGLWITQEDLSLLHSHAYFAACPKTYMKLGMGFGHLWDLRSSLNIGIGTDGAASSGTLNPLEQGRLYSLIAKHLHGADSFTMQDAWKTLLKGHEALGWKTGWVRPDYLADLVLWDLQDLAHVPLHNPLASLLYHGEGRHVCHVLIHGSFVLRHGELMTLNEQELKEEVKKTVCRVQNRAEGKPMAEY